MFQAPKLEIRWSWTPRPTGYSLTVMTALSFPPAPYSELRLRAEAGSGLEVERMELEWMELEWMEVAQYAVK